MGELGKLHLLNFELMVWRQLKQRRNQLRRHHWLMHPTLTVASGSRRLVIAAEWITANNDYCCFLQMRARVVATATMAG